MIHRTREVDRIRRFLDAPAPALCLVAGPPRSGKSHLVRTALTGRSSVWVRGSRLPAPLLAGEMEASLGEQLQGLSIDVDVSAPRPAGPAATPWSAAFTRLYGLARVSHPPVLVLDPADALLEDRRFVREMEALAGELRAHGRQLHVLAVVTDPSLPDFPGLAPDAEEGTALGLAAVRVHVPAFGLREAASTVPGWDPEEVVTLFALVGGLPDFWSRVDDGVRPATNLARLLLAPDAPLRWLPGALVPQGAANAERTLALIRAMARGARSWGELRKDAAVFRSSSELGPYVKGLVDTGVAEVSASLDAGPRSRNRRYALAQPLLAFWHGYVEPRLAELERGAPPLRVLSDRLAPELPTLLARTLPGTVRRYLLESGDERLPARAREVGAVWGAGYDLEVAGTLASGAPVYGRVLWGEGGVAADALDSLGAQIRKTRYGFGRESRLRLLVLKEEPPHELARRAAQLPDAVILGPRDLVGRG